MRLSVLLVISERPIGLTTLPDLASHGIRHLINKELDLEPGLGGHFIKQNAPECGVQGSIEGGGPSVSQAILSWLKALVSSISYRPFGKN